MTTMRNKSFGAKSCPGAPRQFWGIKRLSFQLGVGGGTQLLRWLVSNFVQTCIGHNLGLMGQLMVHTLAMPHNTNLIITINIHLRIERFGKKFCPATVPPTSLYLIVNPPLRLMIGPPRFPFLPYLVPCPPPSPAWFPGSAPHPTWSLVPLHPLHGPGYLLVRGSRSVSHFESTSFLNDWSVHLAWFPVLLRLHLLLAWYLMYWWCTTPLQHAL